VTQGTGLDDLRAARHDLRAVVEEIRAVPGYEDFLAAPTSDDIIRAAAVCPVVYLAVADPGGLALIVRGTEIIHVRLGGLTTAVLRDGVAAHLQVYASYRESPEAARSRWFASLDDITAWLWEAVMEPVIGGIGDAPGIVIVAGGLLGLLPLHAAWTQDESRPTGRRYALDALPISYTPNARSLQAARALAAQTPARRLLAVAEPWPVPGSPLPFAGREAAAAAAAFPSAHLVLARGEATSLSFEHEARTVDVLHLACHGFAMLDSPLDSGLLLADTRMTLRRLLELQLRIRLAVLSACETSLPGIELPDEVVALPTGLLQAGVAGVVASQWSVPDWATAMLMTEFYRCWLGEQMEPGAALRAAQTWLRDTTNAEKISQIEAAAARQAAWLPTPVADAFLDRLYFLEPGHRDHAAPHNWAAFAHVGA
jgi:hypothetical protein